MPGIGFRHLAGVFSALLILTAPLTADAESGAARAQPVAAETVLAALDAITPSVVGIVVKIPSPLAGASPGVAVGSGIVYQEDYVVTNHHVVAGASEVTLLLHDGSRQRVPRNTIWSDPVTDLAVVQAPGLSLRPATLADPSSTRLGEPVLAVGYPLGLRFKDSSSLGVISGFGRSLADPVPWIQTDAPINPGNSGGPLVNLKGEVVGINAWGYRGLGIEGLSFAIPALTIRRTAELLIRDHRVTHLWLGADLAESAAARFGLPETAGLQITDVYQLGPLHADALPRDRLLAVDGKALSNLDDYHAALAGRKAGDLVTVGLRRGSDLREARVALQELPRDKGRTVQGQGIWQNLTPAQTWLGWAVARYYRSARESDFTTGYLKQGDNGARALLLTEWFSIAWQTLHQLKVGGEASPEYAELLAGRARGRLAVTVQVPAGNHYTARLSQHEHQWEPADTEPVPAPALPDWQRDQRMAVLTYSFATPGLNPSGEVRLDLTGPEGSGIRYRFAWALKDLI